ncbi:MAG: MOMP family protein [Simkaniaceae bacterium]|nr:MOMP family protein [Simkaniaceae bacterium]
MKRILTSLALCASSLFADAPSSPPPAGAKTPSREITPCAGPRVTAGWDMFITADFIYWTTRVDGLGSVMSGFNPSSGSGSGKVFNPNWQWNPGFKVGIGNNLWHDGWDTFLDFTWIESHASRAAEDLTLFPMWNIANQYITPTTGLVFASDVDWSFWMNWFDLELGRNCFLSEYLKLRPFMGLKIAFGMQKYQLQYTRQIDINFQAKDTMSNNFHYFGIGPRAGLNSAWQFSEAWSLYGDFALSLLWSQFRAQRRDEARTMPFSQNPGVFGLRTKNQVNTCKPVLELGLGLRWETWFSEDDYHFLIQAGWEEQIWISYNQILKLNEEAAHGDLITQGLTVHFRFDF